MLSLKCFVWPVKSEEDNVFFILVVGLHKCEQGSSSAKGLPRLSKGDELDPVSHQDGGQCGGGAAGDIWHVHILVSLFSSLLVSSLLCPDLTIYFGLFPSFYPRVFEKMFNQSQDEMTMKRYLMSFPSVCSHFSQCGHPLCPEEVSVQSSADEPINHHQLSRKKDTVWFLTLWHQS